VFYGLMHRLKKSRGVRGGFVHIPYSPEQAALHPDAPSLPVETATAALRIIVRASLKSSPDVKFGAGSTH